MPSAVQLPPVTGNPTRTGRGLYRKLILPAGKSLTYQGTKLHLTPELLGKVKESFDSGFLDSTPFTLVDGQNRHNDNPENVRGSVRALELADEGLYATLDVPDALFEHNPKLGVSARLAFAQTRADGRKADVLLGHVAGTLDPHIGGMGDWQRIADLSHDPSTVVDLTAAIYQGDTPMAEDTTSLSPEDVQKLKALLANFGDDGKPQNTPPADDDGDDGLDDETRALLDSIGDDDTSDEPVGASLSAEAQQQIDLANAAAQQAVDRAALIEKELAEARWDRECASEFRGIRKDLLDLAKPVLAAPDPTVFDLSADDGSKVDVPAIVRQLLTAAPRLDLSTERGSTAALEADDTRDFVTAWKRQNGMH